MKNADKKNEDNFFGSKWRKTNLFIPQLSKEWRKRNLFIPKLSKNEDTPKYLFHNHWRNEEKLMHSSLKYQTDKEILIYLFLNNRRNEDKPKYLFLNHRRNEDKLMHSSLNYERKEKKSNVFVPQLSKERKNQKCWFLNYWWFGIARLRFTP